MTGTSVTADNAHLTATTGDVGVEGTAGEVKLSGATLTAQTGTTTATATGGSMTATGANLTGTDVSMTGTSVTADNAHLTATTGDVGVEGTAGEVKLSGATLTAQTGTTTATATNAITATGANLAGTTVSMTGTSVTASGAQVNATNGDATLTATDGTMTLGNAQVTATQTATMEATNALTADGARVNAATATLKGSTVTAANTEVHVTDRVDLTGTLGGVTLSGNSKVMGPAVAMTAEAGDIALDGNVVVGDEHVGDNRANVTLTATAGSIRQTAGSADTGLRGQSLTTTAAGVTKLDAMPSDTSEGNSFSSVTIDSGKDVLVAVNGEDTNLSINAAREGLVDGNLSVNGPAANVTLANALNAKGSATVNAKSITGSDLTAAGRAQLTTALYDNTAEDGVRMTGKIQGSEVLIYTNAGIVNTGDIQSTSGQTGIYRQSKTVRGDIDITRIDSATKVTVYNGNGDIRVGGGTAKDNFFMANGVAGTAGNRDAVTSSDGIVAVLPNGDRLFGNLDPDRIINGGAPIDAGVLLPGNKSEMAEIDRVSVGFVISSMDFRSPTSTYFSLASRPDAMLMSIPVTSDVESDVATPIKALDIVTEAKTQEERAREVDADGEDTLVRSPLDWMVVPKDHQGNDIIRDLRPLPEPDDLGWVVSFNNRDADEERRTR